MHVLAESKNYSASVSNLLNRNNWRVWSSICSSFVFLLFFFLIQDVDIGFLPVERGLIILG